MRDFDIPAIEKIADLNLNLDNIYFERVISVSSSSIKETVYDLEIENMHNYQTSVGIVHNGGGR